MVYILDIRDNFSLDFRVVRQIFMQSFGNKREREKKKGSLFLEYEKWKGEHMDDELLS